MIKPIQIIVGAGGYNPTADTDEYNNPDLKGLNGYVERSGYGTWDYTKWEPISTGGFRLLNGFTFAEGETWFFHVTGIDYSTGTSVYTNGFKYSQVMAALFPRIGWRQPTKTGYAGIVTAPNLSATSNRYFDDFHAACSAANLKDIQDDPNLGTVAYNGLLESIKQSVIMRSLNAVFSSPEYIDQSLLFDRDYANMVEEQMTNQGKFVGYRINIAKSFDKAVQINAATLLFNANCNVTLHLFKEGKKSAVWSQVCAVVANEATIVNLTDLVLTYIGEQTKGSVFYLGYFQDEIDGQNAKAINETSVCWNKTLVFGACPFSADAIGTDNFSRINITENNQTFGLNLEMSSFNDWTQIIVKRPNLFDELIGLTMAYVCGEMTLYSNRSNATERASKEAWILNLAQDLNGSAPISDGPPPVTGLNKRIEREAQRVRRELFPVQHATTVNLLPC